MGAAAWSARQFMPSQPHSPHAGDAAKRWRCAGAAGSIAIALLCLTTLLLAGYGRLDGAPGGIRTVHLHVSVTRSDPEGYTAAQQQQPALDAVLEGEADWEGGEAESSEVSAEQVEPPPPPPQHGLEQQQDPEPQQQQEPEQQVHASPHDGAVQHEAEPVQQQEGQQEAEPVQQQEGQQEAEPVQQQKGQLEDGSQQEEASSSGSSKDAPLQNMLKALKGCKNFSCLRSAHIRFPGVSRFNFPHFFIIGWMKSASTSLHDVLRDHPETLAPQVKEPQFFLHCHHNGTDPKTGAVRTSWSCDPRKTQAYLESTLKRDTAVQSGLTLAAFEASPQYSKLALETAAGIREELPWLKIVELMREPISRHISALVMMRDMHKKTRNKATLMNTCLDRQREDAYACLIEGRRVGQFGNYTHPLSLWLEAYPRDQIYLVQYENLTSPDTDAAVLRELKGFLGLDPKLGPEAMPRSNSRKQLKDGWPMKREQYQELVDWVRPDAEQLTQLVDQHGFADGRAWLQSWEAVWHANLATCNATGHCLIRLT